MTSNVLLTTDGRSSADVERSLRRYLPGLDTRLWPVGATQAVLRAPHFVIPLFLLLIWRQQAPADTGNSPATAVAADASAATPPSGAPHVLPDKPAFNR